MNKINSTILSNIIYLHTQISVLQCGTASLTLRDQDHTTKREGDFIKINTLGSYSIDEMVHTLCYVCMHMFKSSGVGKGSLTVFVLTITCMRYGKGSIVS